MNRPLPHAAVLAIVLSTSGCSMPAGMNENCEWPAGAEGAAQRALLGDVRIAEEVALRYADANFDSKASHGRLRSDCEGRLFALIAENHGVSLTAIDRARQQLAAKVWDPPVHLPLIALYIAAALMLARYVPKRFQRDEIAPAAIATLFLSLLIGIVFQAVSHLWDGVVEMARVGNTHMSYRAERLGWRQYSGEVFVLTVVLFWSAVIVCYRTNTLRPRGSSSGGLTVNE